MSRKKNLSLSEELAKIDMTGFDEPKNANSEAVAQIDINVEDKLLPMNHTERFLDDQQNCPLCGDEMLFTHVTEFIKQVVNEEAHCEGCKIRVKQNSHLLQ